MDALEYYIGELEDALAADGNCFDRLDRLTKAGRGVVTAFDAETQKGAEA